MRIHLVYRETRDKPEVRLLAQIDQKGVTLLKQIRKKFSGYLQCRKSQNTCYYSSVSFANIFKILKFFDRFSLQLDSSYLRYILIRKSYLLIQEKKHLQVSGLNKIQKYKKKLKDMIESHHLRE